MKTRHFGERGSVDGWMISSIVLIVLFLGAGAFGIWSFLGYNEAQTDLDNKIELAQSEAKREQAAEDEAKFAEREKEPNREFVGPEDYGRVSFMYPKTWSVYEATAVESGRTQTYNAYLNPGVVPPVSRDQKFAVRVTIANASYDATLSNYEKLIEENQVTSRVITINGANATRLDGNFSEEVRGSAVVFQVRDKVVTIQTDVDASNIKSDFDKLVGTINFNR